MIKGKGKSGKVGGKSGKTGADTDTKAQSRSSKAGCTYYLLPCYRPLTRVVDGNVSDFLQCNSQWGVFIVC
jgi:hypothetical protein